MANAEIEIDAPPEDVWFALLDVSPDEHARVEVRPPGPIRTGSVVTTRFQLIDDEMLSRRHFVLVDEAQLRIVVRDGTRATQTTTFDLHPMSDGRTLLQAHRVDDGLFLRAFHALVGLSDPLVGWVLQDRSRRDRRLMASLEEIKAHAEGTEPPPPEWDSLDQVELEFEREQHRHGREH